MPTYTYLCENCDNQFDEFQKITEEPIAICPICKSKAKRLPTCPLGIIFKGSGFYETDYKKKSE